MDDDVKLSIENAHAKWIVKLLVGATIAIVAIVSVTCAYNEHVDKAAEVQTTQAAAARAHEEALKAMWEHQKAP